MTIGDLRHGRPSGRQWFSNALVRVLIIGLMILALVLLFIGRFGVLECAPNAWLPLC